MTNPKEGNLYLYILGLLRLLLCRSVIISYIFSPLGGMLFLLLGFVMILLIDSSVCNNVVSYSRF